MYEICEDTVNLPRRHLGPLVRGAVLLHDRGYGAPKATATPYSRTRSSSIQSVGQGESGLGAGRLIPIRRLADSPGIDRDRGAPRDAAPPTPPGIRVRTTAVREFG